MYFVAFEEPTKRKPELQDFPALSRCESSITHLLEDSPAPPLSHYLGVVAMMLDTFGDEADIRKAAEAKYPGEIDKERPGPWFDAIEGLATVVAIQSALDDWQEYGGSPEDEQQLREETTRLKALLDRARENGTRFHVRIEI